MIYPVYIPDLCRVVKFVLPGNPVVQKNNLNIFKRKVGNKYIHFIDHDSKMKNRRDEVAIELYRQYKEQGFSVPIGYLFEASFVFYVERVSEPDLDNLPSLILDAMQGLRVKGIKGQKFAVVIEDDKLLRKTLNHKIVKGDWDYHGDPRTEIEIKRYPS